MLMGGLHESSLNLIMSSTNVGKTLIMCSLATNLIQNGYKVLYVTFEDSENKIASRIAQNMFDISQTQFKLMSQNDFAQAYRMMCSKFKGIHGDSLIVKEYPESSTNALALKSLLKDLEDKKKFRPDVMFVDYIGCMIPNGRINSNVNEASILRTVSQQVRAVGQEWNIPIVSASQTNRGGYNAAEVGLNDIADSFGVTQKADSIISVTQTPEFKDQGIYQLKLLKTRYGNNKEQVATIGVSIEKQRIYDLNSGAAQQTTANIFTAAKSKNNGDENASDMLNDIEL